MNNRTAAAMLAVIAWFFAIAAAIVWGTADTTTSPFWAKLSAVYLFGLGAVSYVMAQEFRRVATTTR